MLGICLSFMLMNWAFPLPVHMEYSQIILAEDSTFLQASLTSDDKWRLKTELSEIIPELKKALVYKEDKYFYYHFGINPLAIVRALANNLLQMKTTSGASTITMQVARLLEPKSRTYSHKVWEMFRAIQLEWHYSKDEILQMYLNLVPYGGNIEGVKSAARLYFNRNPDKLSLAQIVTLTIIPNRPTSLVIGKNNAYIQQERDRWLDRFAQNKVFPKHFIQGAKAEKLEATRLPAPRWAPHFCERIREQTSESVVSTLHAENQKKIQQIVYNYVQRLSYLDIHNAAVIAIDNHSHEVKVYIGSPNFQDLFNAGEVDGIRAIRSPGSTLKPLVYALAMDKGFVTPQRMLADVPSDFSGYEPENFYKQFSGLVTVEQALAQSLNIPAVKSLQDIGLPYFLQKLKQANFRQIAKDEKKLGLSTVLGGCGVSLEELVGLYATFANRGHYQPLHILKTDSNTHQGNLCSPEAAYLITEILTQAERPDLPQGFENTLRVPKVAWKTGTSFGRRDAWSIGYNANYTIGVWVGNFSGEGVNRLIGAQIATPLLFEVFNTLDYDAPADWFNAPQTLGVRWVCSETGLIPNHFCKHQVIDHYIPLISSMKKCDHLKEIWVSEDESMSYCLSCLPNQGIKKKYFPNLSPEIAAFYNAQGLAYEKIPPHNPQCTRPYELSEEAPLITSPTANKEYIIDRNAPGAIELRCKAHNDVQTVYWYINEEFYQSAPAHQSLFFTPTLGSLKISCSDDKGRNRDIQIQVLYE